MMGSSSKSTGISIPSVSNPARLNDARGYIQGYGTIEMEFTYSEVKLRESVDDSSPKPVWFVDKLIINNK